MNASHAPQTAVLPSLRWWPFSMEQQYASVRIRGTRVIAALVAAGVDAALFSPGEPAPGVLILAKRYDPDSLQLARALQQQGTRIVLDMCDNHFYAQTPNANADRRAEHLRSALALADATIASTQALAEALRHEAPPGADIRVIGDAFEEPFEEPFSLRWTHLRAEARYALFRARLAQGPRTTRLLWFGQHGTAQAPGGMLDLLSIMPTLNDLASTRALSLSVISNHEGKFEQIRQGARFPMLYLPWHQATFSRAARLHDVAVLPIQINPFTVCKTNNRVATALLHDLAVVADPIPSYEEFAAAAVRLGDWPRSLAQLCDDPLIRGEAVARGRALLLQHWTLDRIAPQWQSELAAIAAAPARDGTRPTVTQVKHAAATPLRTP